MKAYTFEGMIKFKSNKFPFKKVVLGESEKHALDKLYALFGAKNKVKRTLIEIKSVKEEE